MPCTLAARCTLLICLVKFPYNIALKKSSCRIFRMHKSCGHCTSSFSLLDELLLDFLQFGSPFQEMYHCFRNSHVIISVQRYRFYLKFPSSARKNARSKGRMCQIWSIWRLCLVQSLLNLANLAKRFLQPDVSNWTLSFMLSPVPSIPMIFPLPNRSCSIDCPICRSVVT